MTHCACLPGDRILGFVHPKQVLLGYIPGLLGHFLKTKNSFYLKAEACFVTFGAGGSNVWQKHSKLICAGFTVVVHAL